MKKRQFRGILKHFWKNESDKSRKKRFPEYVHQAVSPIQGFEKIFPQKTMNTNVFRELEEHLDNFIKIKKEQKGPSEDNPYPIEYGFPRSSCRFLFSLCIFSKPDVVVETGVANGFSSAYVLLALNELKKGKLISIDGIFLPWQTREKIGRAIPERLGNRHKLIIGDASDELEELEKVLNEFHQVDIFIHDSDHTYNHMTKEFNIVWSHIKKGGLLLSDDVAVNDAFLDFAERINRIPIIISKDHESFFGLIKK